MVYVDGYVLRVKKKKLNAYKKEARKASKLWIKHGALEYVECVGDDMDSVKEWNGLPFPKMTNSKKDEVVIFAFAKFKSRKHRDAVNKRINADMEAQVEETKKMLMPFDLKTMAYGGFEVMVNEKKK